MSDSIFADRIVQNLLDTDLYKLTMMQAVLHNYPNAEVEWEFRCRNSEDLTPYLAEIRYQFERLSELSLTVDQLAFLERIPFIKPDFIRFLSLFRFNLRYVHTSIEDGQLSIRLRGPWLHVILFEVPLLAIISEVRNRYRYREVLLEQAAERLYEKIDWLRSEASDDELAGFQLADFDLYFAKLFDGLRHDSGDPLVWAEKAIAHYESLGIDPMTKTLVFSDGLDLKKSLRLYRALSGRIHVSFGVGTNLTCDIPGVEPMNIVIKMIACNGQPVAKISDTPGKTQCRDENFVHYLKHVFRVPDAQ
jgi:nicotinic acid phosphoribosyltransferase